MIEDNEFVAALNACKMPDNELADALSVSKPTITRWKAGKNLPHDAMRLPVLKFLESLGH
jgi:hypothetical protein